ncbi:MAG: redoxin family protein [Pseudomonadota bacterium]
MADANNDQQPQPSGSAGAIKTTAVSVAFGLVGFAAVYLSLGPSANRDTSTAPPKQETKANANSQSPTAQPASNTGTSTAELPSGPGKNPLSVGDMAMFVFKPAPAELPTFAFQSDGGKEMTFADLKGKVVLVNLWATWCAPCRKEMPDLNELQQKLGSDDFEVVAISLDRGTADKPKAFLDRIGVKSLAFYHDPTSRLGVKLKTIGMPATLLLDRQGREIGRLVGPAKWAGQDAIRLIRAAITASG